MNKIVYILLIAINVLNLVFSRDGDGGDRFVIQVVNGMLLITLFFDAFSHWKKNEMNCIKVLFAFIALLIVYLLAQFLVIHNPFFALGPYLKWLLGLSLIIFFFRLRTPNHPLFLQVYVITFVIQTAKKIFEGHWFRSAISGDMTLAGGDYASLGLVMVAPLVFIAFDKKKAPIIFLICFALTIISLRRSSIIAFLMAIPIFWPYLKRYFNKRNITWFVSVVLVASTYLWTKIGYAAFVRMQDLFAVDKTSGATATYGSGRSLYWYSLFDSLRDTGNWLFGNGLGSVYEYFCKNYLFVHLSHAHSDFFEILYTMGIIGLFVWVSYCVYFCKMVWKSTDFYSKRIGLGIMVIYGFVALSTGIVYRAEFFPMGIAMGLFLNAYRQNIALAENGV